jgi:hypothetical protein
MRPSVPGDVARRVGESRRHTCAVSVVARNRYADRRGLVQLLDECWMPGGFTRGELEVRLGGVLWRITPA